MISILRRIATWRNTIILLAAQFIVQGVILFLIYPKIGGQGVPLDMRSGITAAEIQTYIASLGEEGRKLYALNEGTADILFPLLYSSAYSFLFLRLLIPMTGAVSRWHLLAWLPFGIAIADVLENVSIIESLTGYEHPGVWFSSLILFNTVKGSLMMVTIIALLILICVRLLFLMKKRSLRTGKI